MTPSRVEWGGLHNARDLGEPGGLITPGALFRSPRLDSLDVAAWQQLAESGVRTIIDLRNDDEVVGLPLRPTYLRVVRAPIEDQTDLDFMAGWADLLGSPDYYGEVLRRWPELIAAAVGAVADAPEGGVLVHCAAGRDRTGLIVALLMRVAGMPVADVLLDYEIGVREINEWLGTNLDREPHLDEQALAMSLAAKHASLAAFLETLDVDAYLARAGVSPEQRAALRARFQLRCRRSN